MEKEKNYIWKLTAEYVPENFLILIVKKMLTAEKPQLIGNQSLKFNSFGFGKLNFISYSGLLN